MPDEPAQPAYIPLLFWFSTDLRIPIPHIIIQNNSVNFSDINISDELIT